MNLILKKHLLLIAATLCFSNTSWSQEFSPHGLGIGINGAVVADGKHSDVAHEALGLHFDHQRNWSKLFALRTSIEFNYFLPDKDSYNPANSIGLVRIEDVSQQLNTTISVEPMFYWRTNAASLYVSLGLLAGDHTTFTKRINTGSDGREAVHKSSDSYFITGIKPSIGVTFHMRDSSDDIDFQFSQNLWGDFEGVIDGELFEGGEYMYVLTITYRFNFLKG